MKTRFKLPRELGRDAFCHIQSESGPHEFPSLGHQKLQKLPLWMLVDMLAEFGESETCRIVEVVSI